MKFPIFLFAILFAISSYAQEDETGDISAPTPNYSGISASSFRFNALFDSFRNQSFRTTGLVYGAELGYQVAGNYNVYFGVPYIYGQIQSKNVGEFGNPYVGGELLLFEPSGLQTWGKLQHKFTRSDAEIAARHNTAIPGIDLRYERLKTVLSFGTDYYWRYGENDSRVDVKDVVSLHAFLGRKLSRRLTLGGEIIWFRAFGVKKNEAINGRETDLTVARESDWAGAGPVAKIAFGSGVLLKSQLLFPVHSSRSQTETEVALWDAGLPKVSEVTWKTDVGVQF